MYPPKKSAVTAKPQLPGEILDLPRIRIRIGGLLVSSKVMIMDTVLGSCISACLYDPFSGAGGMNHFMLPAPSESSDNKSTSKSARYGVYAMELLINRLMKAGAKRKNFQAKIFGGGHVLRIRESLDGVPQRNIDFIHRFLETEGIPIVNEDLGGYRPRRVLFNPSNGKAYRKLLNVSEGEKTVEEEVRYLTNLNRQKLDGDAVIF